VVNEVRATNARDLEVLTAIALRRSDPDEVRNEAMTALQSANADSALDTCGAVACMLEETPRMRAFATQHIGRLLTDSRGIAARDRTLALLRNLLKDDQVRVRREAFAALVAADDPGTLSIAAEGTRAGHEEFDDLIIYHWVERRQADRITAVCTHIDDDREAVRVAAIYACGELGNDSTRQKLEGAKPADARSQRAIALAVERIHARGH